MQRTIMLTIIGVIVAIVVFALMLVFVSTTLP